MKVVYSTYEARARFSDVLRLVREGTTVTVSYRGDPVAEIRPIEKAAGTVEEHFARLEKRGILVPARTTRKPLKAGAPKPGALARFLASRRQSLSLRSTATRPE
ncbi:MAG: type II toxin-antitoxin system prevent-host-death family antitoxin [Gemmatimonadota bacterium]|nr:type II toxin-antitoxin system prevent-host-death family antitoxin [Gemmatimonadota bacterium]MYB05477.1 type II toxin-antitoxin system prevent-host-death family antitoxin [Gemmatimonadota bacterium]MYG21036.1 type II toxin-antitoxin system prevent-host-death family antitoxin [Gemmatimonadota bacterium]MYJ37675.1 type II toxin-antitoxin system prevent-host-death family antitoxin [Gemmatimonadota bacterium]